MMSADYSDGSGDECKSLSPSEVRKANKPLMEKRRRARINESLNMLKSLVLDALKRDTSRYSKLEKADILEMTVKHLRSVQRQQMSAAMTTDSTVMEKYRTGYQECAGEVGRYLTSIDGLEPSVRNRLMNHLLDCVQKVNTVATQTSTFAGYAQNTSVQVQTQYMQPVQVQIPSTTQLVSLPGTPLEGSLNNVMGNPSGNPQGNPALLMVPSYYNTSNCNMNQNMMNPFPTPSPNSSRSSSPFSPPPGKDLNHNDITGCYVDQHEVVRRRQDDQERKLRAFHPYKQECTPKELSSSKKLPLRPIVNQPIKNDNMWRPW